jgi:hypothetical protein
MIECNYVLFECIEKSEERPNLFPYSPRATASPEVHRKPIIRRRGRFHEQGSRYPGTCAHLCHEVVLDQLVTVCLYEGSLLRTMFPRRRLYRSSGIVCIFIGSISAGSLASSLNRKMSSNSATNSYSSCSASCGRPPLLSSMTIYGRASANPSWVFSPIAGTGISCHGSCSW